MKTKYKVIDAVMGTGKSVYVSLYIKADTPSRYIVVLPTLTEVKRYEGLLAGIKKLVSLREEEKGTSKKERFDSALNHASVILLTHALYEDYLDDRSFEQIHQGKWKLVMDEVVTAFETVEASHYDISALCAEGDVFVHEVQAGIALLQHNPKTYDYVMKAGKETVRKVHKYLLKASLVKDLYRVTSDGGHQYYTFSLQERRLSAFEEVVILTYPFKDSELDYWFRIKGIEVEHLNLTKVAKTNSFSDFELKAHTGEYSGKDFKHLIEILEPPAARGKQKYGNRHNHFSSGQMEEIFNPKSQYKQNLQVQNGVRNDVRTLFRNGRTGMVKPEDFMFTCSKASIDAFCDPKHGLPKSFIGPDTFVPFNITATNDYDHKTHLAYLYNVFAFPPIKQAIRAYGLEYDEERNALYYLIQWIWRSAIRDDKKIYLYIPSKRMRKILEDWLDA